MSRTRLPGSYRFLNTEDELPLFTLKPELLPPNLSQRPQNRLKYWLESHARSSCIPVRNTRTIGQILSRC